MTENEKWVNSHIIKIDMISIIFDHESQKNLFNLFEKTWYDKIASEFWIIRTDYEWTRAIISFVDLKSRNSFFDKINI